MKTAFNDHFIRHVIPVQDGGYAVVSELYYSSSKNSAWNRYDYLYGGGFYSPFDMWYSSPMSRMYNYGYYDPFNRFGQQNNYVRHVSENIMVFFFNADGKLRWSNTIRKTNTTTTQIHSSLTSYSILEMNCVFFSTRKKKESSC